MRFPVVLAVLLISTLSFSGDAFADEKTSHVQYAEWDGTFLAGFIVGAAGASSIVFGSIAIGRVSELQNDKRFENYRKGFPSSVSACEIAREGRPSAVMGSAGPVQVRRLCDEASTWQTVAAVTMPIGVVALTVGAYIALTSDTVLAPTANGAAVYGRF